MFCPSDLQVKFKMDRNVVSEVTIDTNDYLCDFLVSEVFLSGLIPLIHDDTEEFPL